MNLVFDEIEHLIRAHEDFHKNRKDFYDSLGRRITFVGRNRQPIERFCQKIVIDENNCWEWIGAKSGIGYGQFAPTSRRKGGILTSPHRFIWAYLYGEIPSNQEVDHQCRNRVCTNPNHLQLVSHQENQELALKKEFCKYGHPYSGDNLHINSQGKRVCKKCRSIRANESLKKRMETDPEFRKKRLEYMNAKAKQRRIAKKK